MADYKTPNLLDIINTARTAFNTVLPDVDFSIQAFFENALISANANIAYSIYVKMSELQNQLGISGRTGNLLDLSGEQSGVIRLQPASAKGNVIFQSDTVTDIAATGYSFLINGNNYKNTAVQTKIDYEFTIVSSNYDSMNQWTVFTLANTLDDNNQRLSLTPKMKIKLQAAPNTQYEILGVLSSTQFTISGNVVQNNNTKFVYSAFNIPVISDVASLAMNANAFSSVTSDVFPDTTGYVWYGGIVGGRDLESDADYMARQLRRGATANKGIFNNYGFQRLLDDNALDYKFTILRGYNQLNLTALNATVYLLHPDATALNQDELDVIIDLFYDSDSGLAYPNDSKAHPMTLFLSPVLTEIDITINNLAPDYPTLRTAITNRLLDYFVNSLNIGQGIGIGELEALINGTIDEVGNKPLGFNLIKPTEDIEANANQKLILGEVDV